MGKNVPVKKGKSKRMQWFRPESVHGRSKANTSYEGTREYKGKEHICGERNPAQVGENKRKTGRAAMVPRAALVHDSLSLQHLSTNLQ